LRHATSTTITSRLIKQALQKQTAKQSANNTHRGDETLGLEMQASSGKLAHKSNEITQTPMQGFSAEVTLTVKIIKREQAHYKKIKKDEKMELADFF
jgi:hypothetical protein